MDWHYRTVGVAPGGNEQDAQEWNATAALLAFPKALDGLGSMLINRSDRRMPSSDVDAVLTRIRASISIVEDSGQ